MSCPDNVYVPPKCIYYIYLINSLDFEICLESSVYMSALMC